MKKWNYNHTIYACFLGYIIQAINNNFAPLLFLRFQTTFELSIQHIALITTLNFIVQLLVDLAAMWFVDRIGYRASAILANAFSVIGLSGLAYFPAFFANPFNGILLAVVMYAIGGGLLEVALTPLVESCPSERKEAAMSLSHSFYCWGHVAVVLLSTVFFAVFGIDNWRILAVLWAVLPICNIWLFMRVPIAKSVGENGTSFGIKKLFSLKQFWLLAALMVFSGASEQAAGQWASAYAEAVLHMPKIIGDLAGPLLFAAMMGLTRVFYGKYSAKLKPEKAILLAGVLCLFSYLLISLTGNVTVGFVGFALCGISVAIFWPGTISVAAKNVRGGGTAMFAFLALAGDVGCTMGPTFVGIVSERFNDSLQTGFFAASIFPLGLILGLLWYRRMRRRNRGLA